jgi:putative endonuclease
MSRIAHGRLGEEAAAAAYVRRGYRVVARNWRCRLGVLVVCEVKSRRVGAYGGGYEAVTWRKRAKLRSLAEAFLQETGFRFGAVRFDVASVSAEGGRSDVEVFEDAF